MSEGSNKACEGCGGEISPAQIIARQAGLVAGVLLCPGCIARKREELMKARAAQGHAAAGASPSSGAAATATADSATATGNSVANDDDNQGRVWFPPERHDKEAADAALSLVDDTGEKREHPQIRSFSEGSTLAGVHRDDNFKRPLAGPADPATRCRTFHGKLTAAGLAHMDEQINDWLDAHPDIFIKSTASTVGVFEGKTKEPHLLVTVFY